MKKECIYNHNPNDIDNSLKMLKKRCMGEPSIYHFVCTECNKILTFQRKEQGAFVEVK